MVITYHGGECFKVASGNTTLAFNPIAKESRKFAPVKFGVETVFVSMHHSDFNGIAQVTYGEKVPFVVSGPGEYEIGEVTARGFGMKTTYDDKELYNTIYQVMLEGINMVFLGALSSSIIDAKILEQFGDVDILFVPVGGDDVLDASSASSLGVKLEAHVIIPMHYDAAALEAFLKEEGVEDVKAEEKFTVKKKELLEREGDIVVLKV
jgi:L-ascorbate metabolism protein UlaG (beta-lactamase superfamily)